MRNLFKVMAREAIATLTVEDLTEIMDNTVATLLERMDGEERMAFSLDIVSRSFRQMVEGLNAEERRELLLKLLPNILAELPADQVDLQALLEAISKTRDE